MNLTIAHIILLLIPSSVMMAQHSMVVVNVESKVPIRDVRVCTDNGQEVRTSWDGSFWVPDSCHRLDFLHPDYFMAIRFSSFPTSMRCTRWSSMANDGSRSGWRRY